MIEFNVEWQDPEGVRSPVLAATWGRLEILVSSDGAEPSNVCDVVTKSGSRNGIYVSLYPLAEWIATHWHVLFNEVSSTDKEADQRFHARHDILSASEGFALPHMTFISQGDHILCEWRQTEWRSAGLRFLSQGRVLVDKQQVSASLGDFVTNVIRRIDEHLSGESTLLEEEWNAINSLDSEEARFCDVLGSLGVDPFSVDSSTKDKIIAIYGKLNADMRDEFFHASNTDTLSTDAEWVTQSLASGGLSLRVSDEIRSMRPGLLSWVNVSHGEPAWERGYRLARRLRDYLGQPDGHLDGQIIDFESVNEYQNASPSALDGLVLPNESRVIASSVSKLKPSRRFDFARALFSLLFNPASYALISKAHTTYQQSSRAFAAELLAPSEGLRQRLPANRAIDDEILERLADEFRVSSWVVRHQVENHQLGVLATSL
jgi:hypothetical protein